MSPELIVAVLGLLAAGGGAYAAVRYDLGRLHERTSAALDLAKSAHLRIDALTRGA